MTFIYLLFTPPYHYSNNVVPKLEMNITYVLNHINFYYLFNNT
jgi:hypothetical protein